MALGLTIYEETLEVGGVGDILLLLAIATTATATVLLGRLAAPDVTDPTPPDAPAAT